jgi:UDP-N-acetylmuramate--alanine ligase
MSLDPAQHRHIHLIGIAGSGMSALARLLLARGIRVSGSDRNPDQIGKALTGEGARIHTGHHAAHIAGADLVVVSSAVREPNPEIDAARAAGVPVIKRADLLAAVVNAAHGIAVAGTHGKTTTTALIGHILADAGLDPSVIVGGISRNFGSNARSGASDLVVVEADEYDATFLRLRPAVAVITNVAAEHLDFYHTEEQVRHAFAAFAAGVTETLVICADDEGAASTARTSRASVITYGIADGEWRAHDITETGQGTSFRVGHADAGVQCSTQLAGEHNVRNALAALAVATVCNVKLADAAASLSTFAGVQRRAEVKGEAGGITVIDDYAVHPTEIRVTLSALKRRYGRPLRAIFQPHTYSRVAAFLPDFARAFADADAVYVMDIYAARETDTLGMDAHLITDAIGEHHSSVRFTGGAVDTLGAVSADMRPGDIIVTLGAGDVTHLGPRLLAAQPSAAVAAEPSR